MSTSTKAQKAKEQVSRLAAKAKKVDLDDDDVEDDDQVVKKAAHDSGFTHILTIILIIVAVLVVVGIIVWYFWSRRPLSMVAQPQPQPKLMEVQSPPFSVQGPPFTAQGPSFTVQAPPTVVQQGALYDSGPSVLQKSNLQSSFSPTSAPTLSSTKVLSSSRK